MTYVDISTQEFTNWVESYAQSTPAVKGWSKKEATKGIFLLYLSDIVAVKISSSLGDSQTKGYAKAAIHAVLYSRETGRVLNKSAAKQSRVNRTTNWSKNLAKVCDLLIAAYQKSSKFYEIIGSDEGLSSYLDKWHNLLISIPNWASNPFLMSIHDQLTQNRVLSDKQEASVLKESEKTSQSPESPKNKEQIDWGAYIETAPNFEKNKFLADLLSKVNQGRPLSPMQVTALVRSVHREKWLDRLRRAYQRASQEERTILAPIGKALGQNFKLDGPSESDQRILRERFPGFFEDLFEGPVNPKLFQQHRTASSTAMADRITALYFASR